MSHRRSVTKQEFMQRLREVTEANLKDENFGVSELAKEMRTNRSTLYQKINSITDKSPSQFIREIRINKAMELLKETSQSVSEVAYLVGFSAPTYFIKCFHDYYGFPPGEVKTDVVEENISESDSIPNPKLAISNKRNNTIKIVSAIIVFILVLWVIIWYKPYDLLGIKKNENAVAVLPFYNLTGQAGNDYFVEGIHEAFIGDLGQVESIRVISRTSTLHYRETNMLLKDIANELGVNTIIEGSVLGAGDSLRLLIQMIDVFPRERHILSKEYQDIMQNVLTLHTSAVNDIVQKLNIPLSKNEKKRLAISRKVDPATYKAYLRGMYYLHQGTDESFEKGIHYLNDAIKRDPGDPFAYAGLALGYATMGHGQLNAKESFLRAQSAAQKAIKLDPSIDESYTALSLLYLYNTWNWSVIKESFENGIANNPNNAIAHAHFAWYYILFNEMDKSIFHAKKAVMIDPLSVSYKAWLSILYFNNNEYEEAEYWAKKALELNENAAIANLSLGWICLKKKHFKQAIEYHKKLPENSSYWKSLQGYAYVKTGQRDKALEIWNEMEKNEINHWINPCYKAMVASYLGFTDKAFELLNEAVDNKNYPITYINFYPGFESLRNDIRYNKILLKMNLPPLKNPLTTSAQ